MRHLMSGVNRQDRRVFCFNQPSAEELKYLGYSDSLPDPSPFDHSDPEG